MRPVLLALALSLPPLPLGPMPTSFYEWVGDGEHERWLIGPAEHGFPGGCRLIVEVSIPPWEINLDDRADLKVDVLASDRSGTVILKFSRPPAPASVRVLIYGVGPVGGGP